MLPTVYVCVLFNPFYNSYDCSTSKFHLNSKCYLSFLWDCLLNLLGVSLLKQLKKQFPVFTLNHLYVKLCNFNVTNNYFILKSSAAKLELSMLR